MPNEWFLVYLAIATIYGYVMYNMGKTTGASALAFALIDAGIVKSQDDLGDRINAYYQSREED